MKNSNYIINGILLLAIIVLFILQFTGRSADSKHRDTAGIVSDSTDCHLPIAYIRTDSLMLNYKFSIDLSETLMKKFEEKKLDFNRKSDTFRKDVALFQEKAQMNAFITPDRREAEQNRLANKQQELENYAAQIDRELSLEQSKMNQQLTDTIVAGLRLFNTPKKYEMIFSNMGTDNILLADDSYDITQEFINFLNDRYVK